MSAAAQPKPKTSPREDRIYYGWAIVAVAALGMVATLPGRTQGLGLITEPLLADLHIGRVSYAAINLWATLVGGLFCLPIGWIIDRWGTRYTTTLVLAALAVAAQNCATQVPTKEKYGRPYLRLFNRREPGTSPARWP